MRVDRGPSRAQGPSPGHPRLRAGWWGLGGGSGRPVLHFFTAGSGGTPPSRINLFERTNFRFSVVLPCTPSAMPRKGGHGNECTRGEIEHLYEQLVTPEKSGTRKRVRRGDAEPIVQETPVSKRRLHVG